MTPFDILCEQAQQLFLDCKVDGFTVERNRAYNVLCSAITYLKTGSPLHGCRTLEFFRS